MACDTPGWTHVTLNVLQENLLGFYFLFDVSKLSKLSLAFYFFTDFLTWNRHILIHHVSQTQVCALDFLDALAPWLWSSLAEDLGLFFGPLIAGLIPSPDSVSNFGFWAPLVSCCVTWTVCYFHSCSFPCGFTWPLLLIIVLLQEKLFCHFGAKQMIKIQSYGTLKKFLSNSSVYWWEKRAQRGWVNCFSSQSVGGWAKRRT